MLAGIQYELVASLCVKGKRGFFRKRKSAVVSTTSPIIIDKHELHSTWPVYCQPESRKVEQDGSTMIVHRNQTCFGPGDRLPVRVVFRSGAMENIVLRGFEITLRETTIFRSGPGSGKKSAAPQVHVVPISQEQLPVNAILPPGNELPAELGCMLPLEHTTTSLNSARHIDITYFLNVKAIISDRPPVSIDLPVVISNWPRHVSETAISRIGPTPTLSLLPISPTQHTITRSENPPQRPPIASTLPIARDGHGMGRDSNAGAYNTLPAHANGHKLAKVDEMGGYAYSARQVPQTSISAGSNHLPEDHRPRTSPTSPTSFGRRPNSAGGPSANRLTIINAQPDEIPEPEPDTRQRAGGSSSQGPWLSAEDEKKRLYEAARAKVERVQGSVARVVTPPPQAPPPQASPPRHHAWPTAEEEKLRLFNKAQAAVAKTQGFESPPSSIHARSDSDGRAADLSRQSSASRAGGSTKQSSAAELYAQAMSARNQAMSRQHSGNMGPEPKVPVPVTQYPTAEQEKAALRRYHEAKMAVDRVQNSGYMPVEDSGNAQAGGSGPIAYEHLYPQNGASGSSSSSAPPVAPANDLPPPFDPPKNPILSHLSEKERLRRAYEEQDAAALARQNAAARASPPPFSAHAPQQVNGSPNRGLSEKEILRRKFEAQDALALNGGVPGRASPPQPPPRANSNSASTGSVSGRSPRPTPTPPVSPARPLTALEEKALLKAQYAAEEARSRSSAQRQQQQTREHHHHTGQNGVGSSQPASHSNARYTPGPPPPLMPRPPVEYIQETQEEDARVSQFAMDENFTADDELLARGSVKLSAPPSPSIHGYSSPPPLPPKPAGG
ncbi:hypothetical protein H0H81_012763 [Sphagnurus paluster]|uniref:Arrestin C-terminal-like domain-containing protein n=1 Tax=Sphagnurus paluster TaxID=117069 RepID=A0A9P7FPM7_9AGAR|nr:hypothetical protein H0H81_012763 [Sphagnurus paluster]